MLCTEMPAVAYLLVAVLVVPCTTCRIPEVRFSSQVVCLAVCILGANSQDALLVKYADYISYTPLGTSFTLYHLSCSPAETVAGKQSLIPRASVHCTEFVVTVQINQGLTALTITQAPHLTAKPCKSWRMSVLSSPLSLAQVEIIAAQRSRSTH